MWSWIVHSLISHIKFLDFIYCIPWSLVPKFLDLHITFVNYLLGAKLVVGFSQDVRENCTVCQWIYRHNIGKDSNITRYFSLFLCWFNATRILLGIIEYYTVPRILIEYFVVLQYIIKKLVCKVDYFLVSQWRTLDLRIECLDWTWSVMKKRCYPKAEFFLSFMKN